MSDIKWYSSLPAHWEKQRTKYLFKIISGNGFPVEMQGRIGEKYPFAKAGTISSSQRYLKKANDSVSQDDVNANGFNVIPVGSIVMPKIGEALKKNSRAVTSEEVCIDNNCQAMVPQNIDTDFAFYLLSVIDMNWYDNKGTIPSVNNQSLKNDKVPYPPLAEQHAIVRYLDSKCSAIDEAIERHKKIIEKLEEYRKAFITELITSGVNDNAELKDSKEEWCGNIPLHWDMVKIKYLFTIRKRIIGYDGPTVLSITQRGIMPKDITSGEGQLAASYANYQIVQPGDFAMNHMDLLTGWVDISQYSGVTSPDYRVFTLDDQEHNDPRYFLYMLQMFYFNRVFYSLGAGVSGFGRWRLQGPVFLNFKVPVPPYKEQREIAGIIENKDSFIRHSIEKHEAIISKLEEYRKSIIYNAVTGKIDCRTKALK